MNPSPTGFNDAGTRNHFERQSNRVLRGVLESHEQLGPGPFTPALKPFAVPEQSHHGSAFSNRDFPSGMIYGETETGFNRLVR